MHAPVFVAGGVERCSTAITRSEPLERYQLQITLAIQAPSWTTQTLATFPLCTVYIDARAIEGRNGSLVEQLMDAKQ